MKHIGLVLSGGMGKGAYQIGALTALCEYFQPQDFEYVSAASIGALNAYAYLTNNTEKARTIWESVNFQREKRFITSVLKSTFLQDIITSIISDMSISNFFYVPLLDLSNKELIYYNFSDVSPKKIAPYLRASIAMPLYNKGVIIGDKTLYDGAIVDNIPIYPILKNKLDYIICIYFDDFNYVFEDYHLDNKIIKITFPDNKIISNSVHIEHESILYMIDEGYRKTKSILEFIFSDGIENLTLIYTKIAKRNLLSSTKVIRITGDVVVTNMNKIVKKFVSHKRIL